MAANGSVLTQRRKGAEVAEKVRLGDVVDINTSSPPKYEGVKRYISTGAIVDGAIVESQVEMFGFSERPSRADLYPKEGDVLFAKMQATRKTFVVDRMNSGSLYSTGFYALTPHKDEIDTLYLSHYLDSEQFLSAKDKECNGATQKALSGLGFKKLLIPLASLSEQKRIAAVLDKICELKKNAEAQIENLDLLVKSRFVEMFGDDKYTEVTIESLAAHEKNAFKAGPFGSSLKKEFYVESGYKIYGQEQVIANDVNFGDYYVDEAKYKSLESCKVQEGDVLVSLVGTYGKTLIIPRTFQPGIINPRLIKLTFDKKRIEPVYFQHFFMLDSTRKMLDRNCHGCTMGVLNLGIIKALRIPLPPLALQREFAAFVEKVEKLKDVAKKSVEEMDTLYRAKLQEYFG